MGQTVELLENALRAWEDIQLLNEAETCLKIAAGKTPAIDYTGPIRHWRELRKHLLHVTGNDFDYRRFSPEKDVSFDRTLHKTSHQFQTYPLQLASWTLSSRRVFQISEDLASRFLAGNYDKYRWSDLLWPFDSFVICLEKPTLFDLGPPTDMPFVEGYRGTLSAILISSIFGVARNFPEADENGFEIRPFFSSLQGPDWSTNMQQEILTATERERLEKRLREKRWKKLDAALSAVAKKRSGPALDWCVPGQMEPYFAKKRGVVQVDAIGKIIAGLCLYLEALPAGTVEDYPWQRSVPIKARREVRKIVTNGGQVCRIEDFHTLSPETIRGFLGSTVGPARSVTPHWRRAHYRRKKGEGKNPHAPRDVYIGPALIHKDQLPDGAVPGGAKSTVR